ncbi:unnamed protein product [Phyllotreta striolata]|uniref:Muscle M-line assembly protein unc-89 n=1 Tax=Phyllotreta striolata TaxID=444603 RepID=A0A9N9THE6_PHYSR|nr:unnamed protein product [Phyllotreta striolata]
MGNAQIKPHPHPRQRNKKQVHWKAAARPYAPGKPHLVPDAEPAPDLVTIRWSKPISDGGSPISGYLVEHRRSGSPHWVRAAPHLVPLPELTVTGLEPGWRYQFRVSAQNAVGLSDPSDLSELITVTLQRCAVAAPRVTQELRDTVALENAKAEFVVHFLGQPAPKVSWYKDAFEIFSSRRIRILTEPDRSVLTIHQTALADEGEIKCTATNRAGHVSTKARLTVNAPPTVRLPRQYEDGLLFEIGESMRLKVSIAGRPAPLVFWTHDGESIKTHEIEHVDGASVLKIDDAKREDRGEYAVKAVNKLGEDVQSFLVTVTDKPSPPGRARVVMALGKSVTLSWSTPQDDGGCKIGNYIVEYLRLGWDVWLKAATSRQLTTTVGDLIEGSEYKFRIKAESPYGISEPSEETQVVFIPDAKRGILQPPPRARSQSRELEANNRQRSSSALTPEPPKRPARTKAKTPEASPLPSRREQAKRDVETKLNKEIFERSDRSSMARDLAYGSPDIKIKKDLQSLEASTVSSGSDHSRTPSPNTRRFKVTIEPPPQPTNSERTPPDAPASPEMRKLRLSRENSENLTGSSEFMLVLYPDDNQKGHREYDFSEASVPPPMSLSAPELGAAGPIFNPLKTSASSSEILHERATSRLYEAAKAEEKELEKRRRSVESKGINIDIPKIQVNSMDRELGRLQSVKRRLSGGTTQQLRLRRRFFNDEEATKSDLSREEKRAIMMNRQRSESEEMEEKLFEGIRNKMALETQSSTEKRKIHVADEEKWDEDYISSTEESSYEEEDEESLRRKLYNYSDEEEEAEDRTYHPQGLKMLSDADKEPFEILTKKKEPPSPDFVPKPILKKADPTALSPPTSPKSKRSLSPIPPSLLKKDISLAEASLNLPLLQRTIPEEEVSTPTSRQRSASLTYQNDSFFNDIQPPPQPRQRATSLLPQVELFQQSLIEEQPPIKRERSFSLIPNEEKSIDVAPESIYSSEKPAMSFLMQTISAAATITGITAASIVIPDRLIEKRKDAEEAKVVADHYSDIVKSYGNKKRNPFVHKSRESLQRLDESREELSAKTKDDNKPGVNNYHDPYSAYSSRNLTSPVRVESKSNVATQESMQTSTVTSSQAVEAKLTKTLSPDRTKDSRISSQSDENYKIPQSDRALSPTSSSRTRKASPSNSPASSSKPFSPERFHRNDRKEKTPSPLRPNRSRTTSQSSDKGSLPRTPPASSALRSTRASPSKRKTASPYPANRRTSPSPMRRPRPPKLREITTQTSEGLGSFEGPRAELLLAETEVRVHRFVDYLTDLAVFAVACWLYLFESELLAIPVLLVLVFRQLQAEVGKRIPGWMKRLARRMRRRKGD